MTLRANRLEALQVLRAIAAGMVVYVHALSTYNSKVSVSDALVQGYGLGELGVKLFFCISGFIIFSSSQSLDAGWHSVSYFLRRRLIRVAPLYWCATLIYAGKLALQGIAPSAHVLIGSIFFIPFADASGLMRPVLGVGWTLNYEMFFYLVLGGALFFSRRFRLVAVSVVMISLISARSIGLIAESTNFAVNAMYLLSENYLIFFVAGSWIGALGRFDAFLKFPKFSWEITSFVVICLLVALVLFSIYTPMHKNAHLLLEILVCSVSVLLCAIVRNTGELRKSGRVSLILVLAGDASYSTYLTHGFVMGPMARLLAVSKLPISMMEFSVAMVLLCAAIGMLIFKYIENPILQKINARWGRKI